MKQVMTFRKKAIRKHAKKELSIHEIAPLWSRIIPLIPNTEQQQFYKKGKVLDISEAKWCIVGEAHGFKKDYFEADNEEFCRDCFAHSVEFGALLLDRPSQRRESIQNFVDHWNTTHV